MPFRCCEDQTREFEALGSTRTLKVDVRIIAATDGNLEARVRMASGTISFIVSTSFPIVLPPLRNPG